MANADSGPAAVPSLSLIVATVQGWPGCEPVFVTQRAAIDAVGGEMIVVDGSGHPRPDAEEIGPDTSWISAPGEGVFQLRRYAYPLARAPIVAVTEDHCALGPEWGRIALDLHREYPAAAVIGGVVENGTPYGAKEWVLFFLGHFRDMPGVGQGRRVSIAGLTNVTYKRRALESLHLTADIGVNEAGHQRALSAAGDLLLIDDRLRVSHLQSPTPQRVLEISWHSSRVAAALRRERPTAFSTVRLIAAPISPFIYAAMIGAAVLRHGYAQRAFVASLPLMVGILALRAIAEITGYTAGPGDERTDFLRGVDPDRPMLSVVVATRDGWRRYRPMYEAHRSAVAGMDAEIIVVDGSKDAVPGRGLSSNTRWLKRPGESVLELRLTGYRVARGAVIAQSEDHVRVAPDWGTAILRAHAEYPDAAAIGGPVQNGSSRSATDWALFFVGQGRFMPPLGVGVPTSILGFANVSYKEWAIKGIEAIEAMGANEVIHQRTLARSGATLLFDDRIRCEHVQHLSPRDACRLTFAAGRAMAAMRRHNMRPGEFARLLATPLSPVPIVASLGVTVVRRRRYRRAYAVTLPLITALCAMRAAGEMVGYLRGAGASALSLH